MKKNIQIINGLFLSFSGIFFIFGIIFLLNNHPSKIIHYSFKESARWAFQFSILGLLIFYFMNKFKEEARIFLIFICFANLPIFIYDFFYSFLCKSNNRFYTVPSSIFLIVIIALITFYSLNAVKKYFKFSPCKLNKKNKKYQKKVFALTIFFLSIAILFLISFVIGPFLFKKTGLKISDHIKLITYFILFIVVLYNMTMFKNWARWAFIALLFVVIYDRLFQIIFEPKYRQMAYYIFELLGVGIIVFFNLEPVRILFESNDKKTKSG